MKILVTGAGIAGLACAIALADRGHDVVVLERRPRGQAEGAGVILWPQAYGLLRTSGLVDALHAHAAPLHGLERRHLAGERLQAFDFRAVGNALPLAILRAHLVAVLEDAAQQRGVVLHFSRAAVDVLDVGGPLKPAVVACAAGGRFEADLVVGADGRMNSVVGQHVRGIARVDHHLLSWVGAARHVGSTLDAVAVDLWGDGARFGVVPCGAGRAYWAATVRQDLVDDASPWRETVQAVLQDQQALIADVLAATDDAAVHRYQLFDLEPGGPWHRDRLVLVGDAAHASLPTTGRGASEALLDAEALAAAVGPSGDFAELQDALTRYTQAREAQATANVRAARELSQRVFGPRA